MGAVAEGGFAGAFALAEGDALGFVDLEFEGLEGGAFVAAVAVGLVFRLAAGAPPVGAGGEVEFGGDFGGDVGIRHAGESSRFLRSGKAVLRGEGRSSILRGDHHAG